MFPARTLKDISIAWLDIKSEQRALYGILLYTVSDHHFPEYVRTDGMLDLNDWIKPDCSIIIMDSPSRQWLAYARDENNAWWRSLAKRGVVPDDISDALEASLDEPLLQIAGKDKSLREVLGGANPFSHADEIAKVLDFFALPRNEHPSLLLFKDFFATHFWFVDLSDMLDTDVGLLRIALRRWFRGPAFKKILASAAN